MKVTLILKKSVTRYDTESQATIYARLRDGRQLDLVAPTRLTINPNLWDDKAEQVKSKVVCDEAMRTRYNNEARKLKTYIERAYQNRPEETVSLILKQLDNHYSIVFITRKVFFYGVLTILPMFLFRPLNWDNVLMMQPIVFGNLLFLGFVASMLCFIAWNACVKELGAVKSTNYIYIVPLVTLLTSSVIINEKITWIALTGCFLILCGVYLAERKTNPTFEAKS